METLTRRPTDSLTRAAEPLPAANSHQDKLHEIQSDTRAQRDLVASLDHVGQTTTTKITTTTTTTTTTKTVPQTQSSGQDKQDQQQAHQQANWLAKEIKDKLASQRSGEGATAAGGSGGGSGKKRFLESLIGERGKSWLEQRTVIVDIRNGRNNNNKPTRQQQLPPQRDETSGHNKTSGQQVRAKLAAQEEDEQDDQRSRPNLVPATSADHSPSNNKSQQDDGLPAASGQRESAASQSKQPNQVGGEGDTKPLNRSVSADLSGSKRLPTFGTIPQKLTRLPYFSYHGKARNVELSSATQRTSTKPSAHQDQHQHQQPLATAYHTLRRSDGSAASLTSSPGSSSQKSSSSCSSSTLSYSSSRANTNKIPTLTRTSKFADTNQRHEPQPVASGASTSLRKSLLERYKRGYSNISNLFPSRPMPDSRTRSREAPLEQRQYRFGTGTSAGGERLKNRSSNTIAGKRTNIKSASLLNLNNEPNRYWPTASHNSGQRSPRAASSSSMSWRPFQTGQNRATTQSGANRLAHSRSRSHTLLNSPAGGGTRSRPQATPQTATSNMRRQNTGLGGYASGAAATLGGGGAKRALGRVGGAGRPASAAGNYLSSAGGRHHQRSPSASSLHYGRQLGSAGLSPYGLVDPDCPVHGTSPTGYQSAANGRGGKRAAELLHGSEPDLLYDDHHHHYHHHHHQPGYYPNQYEPPAYKSPIGSLYSPVSPVAGGRGTKPAQALGGAYYNSAGKFSVYHAGEGAVRSSLAPTGEQLRRILGYRPPDSKPVHLHPQWAYSRPFIHLQPSGVGRSPSPGQNRRDDHQDDHQDDDQDELNQLDGPQYAPFNQVQDAQAIRAVDFHPSGEVYAVGSNSRALRICAYPAEHELRHFSPLEQPAPSGPKSPRILFKFLQVHRGSIYCVSFNPGGNLLATGSNDQTVQIVRYNSVTHNPDGDEYRLTIHDGTVRDLCFIDDSTNGSSLLLSAGGGDNKIYVTDCDTITPFQSMAGHTQMVMALSHCAGAQFVSGSYDKTIRFWDLRARNCTSIVSAPSSSSSSSGATGAGGSGPPAFGGPGAPVCALKVDPSGRLLASGHTDSTCMLYDIRGAKIIQTFMPHDDEIRAISFSPKSYYLLTGAYDGRLMLSDLQGDLTQPLPSVCVAESQDKIVQAKWHPNDFTFVSTSADKTATLWALPSFD